MLVVEDDPSVATVLQINLEREGFDVSVAGSGDDAILDFRRHEPALILLDLMLPGTPGLEVCRTVRAESNVPIIILSARDDEIDKVVGLELGADDYVTKPFSPPELMSRVRASIRRSVAPTVRAPAEVLTTGAVTLNLRSHEASIDGRSLSLSAREFELLELLVRADGGIVTIDRFKRDVWKERPFSARILYTHVMRLRTKLELEPAHPHHLLTVRGFGYRLVG